MLKFTKEITIGGYGCSIGSDPEAFLRDQKTGLILGGEKVLRPDTFTKPLVVPDGVQVEFHPVPYSCRANGGNAIQACFVQLDYAVRLYNKANGTDLRPTFEPMVDVTKSELLSLSEHAQMLGCGPSLNVWGIPKVEINGLEYLKRSAGGHFHIANQEIVDGTQDAELTVKALDLFVGITSVLLDRDPSVAERRKNYGRAGEYRLPKHGLEYRTLSNFWLRSYQMWSLFSSLVKLANQMACPHSPSNLVYLKTLLEAADEKEIVRVIQESDLAGAQRIYQNVVRPFYTQLHRESGVHRYNFKDFDKFLERPIEAWFPTDPWEHWLAIPDGHGTGWETFIQNTVRTYAPQVVVPEMTATVVTEIEVANAGITLPKTEVGAKDQAIVGHRFAAVNRLIARRGQDGRFIARRGA